MIIDEIIQGGWRHLVFVPLRSGVASGGMIPKLETAIAAVDAGVVAVVILDGRRPHAMLTELFTEHGAGTLIKA